MGNESKIIRKTDDSAMALLYELFGEKAIDIAAIDSYYNIAGSYHFLEFLKCDGSPWDYELNSNWSQLKGHILLIWEFVCKADGVLWLICHDANKKQFKVFRTKSMDNDKSEFYEALKLDMSEFKAWFQKLNSDVLTSK